MHRVEEDARVLYAVFPGMVESREDYNNHFVTAKALIRLYCVPPVQCVIIDNRNVYGEYAHLIPLRPRRDGDYSVAKVIEEMSWN